MCNMCQKTNGQPENWPTDPMALARKGGGAAGQPCMPYIPGSLDVEPKPLVEEEPDNKSEPTK